MNTLTNNAKFIKSLAITLIVVFTTINSVAAHDFTITKQEILQAQKEWSNGLVAIGKAYTAGKDYQQTARDLINTLYAYQTGQVLFIWMIGLMPGTASVDWKERGVVVVHVIDRGRNDLGSLRQLELKIGAVLEPQGPGSVVV